MKIESYPFFEADSEKAYDEWGANCGPNALAFSIGVHIDRIRGLIPRFDERRYTSPTMMADTLRLLGIKWAIAQGASDGSMQHLFDEAMALVRVQWCGPWTAPGANPKWAYRQTHWIAAWKDQRQELIFDVNGGVLSFRRWQAEIIPAILRGINRADGKWFPTHVWRLQCDRGLPGTFAWDVLAAGGAQ